MKSKPAWPNAFWCSTTPALFLDCGPVDQETVAPHARYGLDFSLSLSFRLISDVTGFLLEIESGNPSAPEDPAADL